MLIHTQIAEIRQGQLQKVIQLKYRHKETFKEVHYFQID